MRVTGSPMLMRCNLHVQRERQGLWRRLGGSRHAALDLYRGGAQDVVNNSDAHRHHGVSRTRFHRQTARQDETTGTTVCVRLRYFH